MALLIVGHIIPAKIRPKTRGIGRKRAAVRIRIIIAGTASKTSAIRIRIMSVRPPSHPAIRPMSTPSTNAISPLVKPKVTVFRMAKSSSEKMSCPPSLIPRKCLVEGAEIGAKDISQGLNGASNGPSRVIMAKTSARIKPITNQGS